MLHTERREELASQRDLRTAIANALINPVWAAWRENCVQKSREGLIGEADQRVCEVLFTLKNCNCLLS